MKYLQTVADIRILLVSQGSNRTNKEMVSQNLVGALLFRHEPFIGTKSG